MKNISDLLRINYSTQNRSEGRCDSNSNFIMMSTSQRLFDTQLRRSIRFDRVVSYVRIRCVQREPGPVLRSVLDSAGSSTKWACAFSAVLLLRNWVDAWWRTETFREWPSVAMVTAERECLSGLVDDGHVCGAGGSGAFVTYGESLRTGNAMPNVRFSILFYFE